MVDAIVKYPEMIAGKKRYCTDLMRLSEGKLIGKTGADGVYSLGIIEQKIGICIKIDDGKMGPQYHVAQHVIEQLDILNPEAIQQLKEYVVCENKNFAQDITGLTKVSDNIKIKL